MPRLAKIERKIAPQAGLWYNEGRNIVAQAVL